MPFDFDSKCALRIQRKKGTWHKVVLGNYSTSVEPIKKMSKQEQAYYMCTLL